MSRISLRSMRATRRSLLVGLDLRPRLVEGGELLAGRVDRNDVRKLVQRHVEPPCRALSKAGSFSQAASTTTMFGNLSSGTFNRRAFATCGTRQTSASVTLSPNA